MNFNFLLRRSSLNMIIQKLGKDGPWLHWEIDSVLNAVQAWNSIDDLKFKEQYGEIHSALIVEGRQMWLSRLLLETNSKSWAIHDAFGRVEYVQPDTLEQLAQKTLDHNLRARDCLLQVDPDCNHASVM